MEEPPDPDPLEGYLATFAACLARFVETLSCCGTEADRDGTGDDRSAFAAAPMHILNRALVKDALDLDDARWHARAHMDRLDHHRRGGLLWSERLCTRIFERWGLTNSPDALWPPDVAGWRWTLPSDEQGVNAIHYGPALTVRDDELRALRGAAKLATMEGRPKARAVTTPTLAAGSVAARIRAVRKKAADAAKARIAAVGPPSLKLLGPDEHPIIRGVAWDQPLNDQQYRVLKVLLARYPYRTSLAQLRNGTGGVGGAAGILGRLSGKTPWNEVIEMGVEKGKRGRGKGYAIKPWRPPTPTQH